MTNERLTDAEIIETVAAMRMEETHKTILRDRALAGDAAARFTVYGAWRKQNGVVSSLYAAWLSK